MERNICSSSVTVKPAVVTNVILVSIFFMDFRFTGGHNFGFPIDFAGHRYNSAATTTQPVIMLESF